MSYLNLLKAGPRTFLRHINTQKLVQSVEKFKPNPLKYKYAQHVAIPLYGNIQGAAMREDLNGPVFDNEIPNQFQKGKHIETMIAFTHANPSEHWDIGYDFEGELDFMERVNIITGLTLDISNMIECEAHNYWDLDDHAEDMDLLDFRADIMDKDGDRQFLDNESPVKIMCDVFQCEDNPEESYAYFYRYGKPTVKKYNTREHNLLRYESRK